VLLAAALWVPRAAELPAALAGFGHYATWIVLALAGSVSLAFQRGRAVFALLSLAIAYAAFTRYLQPGVAEDIVFAVFGAMCLFVPFNLAALSLLRERGLFNRHGLWRLAVIALQVLVAAWAALPGNQATREGLYADILDAAAGAATPLPQVGLAAIAMSVIIACGAWYRTRSAIDLAFAGAAIAFGAAAHGVTTPGMFAIFVAAGGLILAIGVLQDTFRMAFRDELTGLPSRRAWNERLAGLGRHYAIAMLDVDHFKSLNDTHGHDIGDQVLKLVASRIARIRGGGTAYRFGGEEFALIFPGNGAADATVHLEALREEIAGYKMEIRRSDRPGDDKPGRQRRAARHAERTLSVTVSIGVAESGGRHDTPEAVVQAADKALYRAKDKGRNRVSR
jgi:GGDEF domain-containing protein